jgi:hypothetical protein
MFFPQGPINDGMTCMVGYWNGTDLYVLTDASTISGNPYSSNYILEKSVVTSGGSVNVPSDVAGRIAVFEVGGTTTTVTMSERSPTSTGALSYTVSGTDVFANKSISPPSLIASQSIYAEWGPPTVFLSGAPYTLKTPDSKPISFYKVTSPGVNELVSITPIFIPTVFYFSCSKDSGTIPSYTCSQSTDPTNALLTAYCGLGGGPVVSPCAASSVPTVGWTTQSDAIQNHPYNYCPASTPNCSPNCKAPCSNGYDSCEWDGTQFSCSIDPNKIFSGEWWKSWWFIGLMIMIGFLLLVFFIFLINASRKKD